MLNDSEGIAIDLRPHWWFLSRPMGALVGAVLLGILVIAQTLDRSGAGWDLLRWTCVVLILAGLVWLGVRYLKWLNTRFVVTTDRVIFRTGVLTKRGIEIPLERVNTVFFTQTLYERLIGTGTIGIESAGESGKQSFPDIRKPVLVQNTIYRHIEANNARRFGTQSRPHGSAVELSIPEQIEKLDDLRQRGVISEGEFAAKKTDLLNRL